MSADLHVRAFDPAILPESLVRRFITLSNAEWPEGPDAYREHERQSSQRDELYAAIYAEDREGHRYRFLEDDCEIGPCSYLHSNMEGSRRYVPRVVEHFDRAYFKRGDIVLLTPGFCAHLLAGFNLPHDSVYENRRDSRGGTPKRGLYGRSRFDTRGVAKARSIKRFFQQNMGLLSFLETQ